MDANANALLLLPLMFPVAQSLGIDAIHYCIFATGCPDYRFLFSAGSREYLYGGQCNRASDEPGHSWHDAVLHCDDRNRIFVFLLPAAEHVPAEFDWNVSAERTGYAESRPVLKNRPAFLKSGYGAV